MSYKDALNNISYQSAIMLSSSAPKYGGDREEEKDKEPEGVDAFGWLSGFANKPKK